MLHQQWLWPVYGRFSIEEEEEEEEEAELGAMTVKSIKPETYVCQL